MSRYRAGVGIVYGVVAGLALWALIIAGIVALFLAAEANAARRPPTAPPAQRISVDANTSVREAVYTLVLGFQLKPDPAPRR